MPSIGSSPGRSQVESIVVPVRTTRKCNSLSSGERIGFAELRLFPSEGESNCFGLRMAASSPLGQE